MKNYIDEMVDLTGDRYLNPVPAIYDNGQHIRSVSTIKSISIHHDATNRPHDYDSIARYRSEATEHYKRLGPGLQYHYKIDNTGVIFKIRPHDTWLYTVGSAENTSTIAICLDGYFHQPQNQVPTREQFEALGQLLVKLCEQSPEFPATYPDVRPHRDFSATACPGDLFAPWVFAIQSKADVLNIPSYATYDWPEYQALTPPVPVQAPVTPPVAEPAPVEPPVVPTAPTPVIDIVIPESPLTHEEANVPTVEVPKPEVAPTVEEVTKAVGFFETTLGRTVVSVVVSCLGVVAVSLQSFSTQNVALAGAVSVIVTVLLAVRDLLNKNIANLPK